MITINSKTDFENVIKELDEIGFYIHGSYNMWEKFLEKQVYKANTLNLDVNANSLIKTLGLDKIDNIEEIHKVLNNHFSKFAPDDKLNEELKKLNLAGKDIKESELNEYRQRYLKTNKHKYCWGLFADLSKPVIKIKLFSGLESGWGGTEYRNYQGSDADRAIRYVIKHIFNEDIEESFHYVKTENLNVWRTFGKVEIKQYKNGIVDIKHPEIFKLKDALYNTYKDRENYFIQL